MRNKHNLLKNIIDSINCPNIILYGPEDNMIKSSVIKILNNKCFWSYL